MEKISFVPFKNFSSLNFKLLNILFFCFPISFILGKGVTNLVVVLICLIGILTFSKKLFQIRSLNIYVVFAFFLILYFLTLLDIFQDDRNPNLFKSSSYFRYFLFFLVTSFLVENDKFNFKYFLISSFSCIFLLSFHISYQFLMETDILVYKFSGFMKDYIAGGYIQKFSIFSIIFFPLLFKKIKKYKFQISCLLMVIFFSGVFFSGNRMPLLIFIFSIFLIIILIKDLRFPLIFGALICSLIFYIATLNKPT